MKTIKTWLTWGAMLITGGWLISLNYRLWLKQQKQRLQTESQIIETACGPVEYYKEGNGPAVLLLHGSPGGYDHALALARFINLQGHTTLTISRPGYRRTPLSSGATPAQQADLCAALLDTLQIKQAIVIALSGGGPTGLEFALRYKDHCRGLVLYSAVIQDYHEDLLYTGLPPLQRTLKQILDRIIVTDPFLYLASSILRPIPGLGTTSAFISTLVMIQLDRMAIRMICASLQSNGRILLRISQCQY